MEQQPRWRVHLRGDDTALLIDVGVSGMPAVLHWGRDWGQMTGQDMRCASVATQRMDVDNVPDIPLEAGLIPAAWTGWSGRPGLTGYRRGGVNWSPRLRTVAVVSERPGQEPGRLAPGEYSLGSEKLVFELTDPASGLDAAIQLAIESGGVISAQASVTNTGTDDYHLEEMTLAFPVPLEATEILDFTGHWGKERVPQRHQLTMGCHLREHRRGRPGFDASTLLLCGYPGFTFRRGEVRGLHVGTGSNSRCYVERLPEGQQVLAGGELLLPGEITLQPGERYEGPVLYLVHGDGLDEAANRMHRWVRAQPAAPGADRPVTLNVWEAVGFDHHLDKLLALADAAAGIGVERFVLDDGWFLGRRDDTAGLGDWEVDPEVWPDGLHPLADHVRGLGMEFGLWFEPEMINADSQLARRHPEWILAAGPQWPLPWRNQQVLDLTIADAWEHVWSRIDALLREYPIAYIKWDCNRDTFDAGSQLRGGRAVAKEQMCAVVRMMDRLRADHPGLEIESCSSGGARIDLEMVRHAQRFWVSDCIDPHERQAMFRWTTQLVPAEYLGTHVASGRSHTTGRRHDLAFRATTALWGHMGVEWDLTSASPGELAALREWVAYFKANRDLLLNGRMVRDVVGDDSLWLHGVVSQDQRRACYELYTHQHGPFGLQGRLRLPGLAPQNRYRVQPRLLGDPPAGLIPPPWFGDDLSGIVATGAILANVGLTPPDMFPEQALILEVQQVLDDQEG